MLPNNIDYYIFLCAVTIALAATRNFQIHILLISSLAYYFITSQFVIFPIISVILITYYGGHFIYITRKKNILLGLVLFAVIGQLAFYKYLPGTLLPLGISYYSFMSLGYAIDIYRGKMQPEDSLIKYALFVSFYPVVTSGPIIRAQNFLAQSNVRIKITPSNLQMGVTLITIGLIMKLVFADNLGSFVDPVFADPLKYHSRKIILATIAFGIQLYCDFGGYSCIALGTARIFGFVFPMNFNNPYFATSPQDFWHRWNISLSCWLRDYLYIPLGGNRKGALRTHINLVLTMIACGLWHGATWNYLLWGGYHGVLLCIQRIIHLPENRMASLAGVFVTQYLMFLGWLIFRVDDISNLASCLSKFLVPTAFSHRDLLVGGVMIFLLLFFRDRIAYNNWIYQIGSSRLSYWFAYLLVAMNLIYWGSPVKVTKFIYLGF